MLLFIFSYHIYLISLCELTSSELLQKFKSFNFRFLWRGDLIFIEANANVVVCEHDTGNIKPFCGHGSGERSRAKDIT